MPLNDAKPRADDIADAIRARICLQPVTDQTLLLEGTLAAEFGVSRTPVRQALQRLSYEGLIEVRTGVGSFANALDPADRGLHLAVHCGLLRLVGALPDAPVPRDIARRLDGLSRQAQHPEPMDATTTFELVSELNANLSRLIPDPVIADAHLVSGWRVLRWFLADLHHDESDTPRTVVNLCRLGEAGAGNGRAALFAAAAALFEPSR
ncbi:winged helix-turn-helix domain-containing protein [Frigidibacter mobilis]|nr:winged helix-turn-helix domain-containing protein [Frigidibacter mobilis]